MQFLHEKHTSATTRALLLLVSCVLLSTAGCGEEDSNDGEGEDPGEHACEHVSETPEAVTAGESRDATAPEVHIGGEPYDVALPDGLPGYLRIEVAEETEALAFIENANVLTELYYGDDAEGVTSSGANEHCPGDIADHFHLHFHEAGTYYLELGPTASNGAWLVLTSDEGHGHDDH